MKKALLLFIVVFIIGNDVKADSTFAKRNVKPQKTNIGQDLGYDLKYLLFDWGSFFIEPFKSTKNLVISSVVVGGTIISSTADKEVRNAVSIQGAGTYNQNFWDIPTAYGFVQYPSIFAGAMYTVGLLARESELRKTGRMLIQSLLYSGTVTMGLRYVLGRTRPFSSKDGSQYEFTWFQSQGDSQSFPSGHTVVAFCTSTILAEQIDTWWARAILYPFAALTGYARLRNDKHWLSDIIFGAALGYGTSKFVLSMERSREEKDKSKMKKGGGFSIFPSLNGLSVTYGF